MTLLRSLFKPAPNLASARQQLLGRDKLHLGCGGHLLPSWANVDLDGPEGVVCLDLSKPLPVADGAVKFVFCEHFIEHISAEQGRAFLRECCRVLRPGGVMRVSTPDLNTLVQEYLAGRVGEWRDVDWSPATPCAMINEGLRLWGHQFVYDEAELVSALKAAGFSNVGRMPWHESGHVELRDLETRPYHRDLILEATK